MAYRAHLAARLRISLQLRHNSAARIIARVTHHNGSGRRSMTSATLPQHPSRASPCLRAAKHGSAMARITNERQHRWRISNAAPARYRLSPPPYGAAGGRRRVGGVGGRAVTRAALFAWRTLFSRMAAAARAPATIHTAVLAFPHWLRGAPRARWRARTRRGICTRCVCCIACAHSMRAALAARSASAAAV